MACDQVSASRRTEGGVNTRNYDEFTVEHWRLEPRHLLEFEDPLIVDEAPPLWKDLMIAALFVLVLLAAAAAVLG
jgi:hypothetical protein